MHPNGECDTHVIEAVGLAIRDGAVSKKGSEALLARLEQRLLAFDIEISLQLAREASLGQVFGGGAGPNRYRTGAVRTHVAVGLVDCILEVRREWSFENEITN